MLSAGLLVRTAHGQPADAPLITRAIPGSGERLPAVGLGTAYVFDSDNEQTRRAASEVLATLVGAGGRLIDTASSYGNAEIVLGSAIANAGLRDKVFLATKLEAPDAAELRRSQTRLKTGKFDLLQFHNVSNPRQSLAQFKDWKAQGICRYIGITSTFHRDFHAIRAPTRKAGFCASRLFGRQPRGRQADFAAGSRGQGRGVDCPAFRQRPAVPHRAWSISPRLGKGFCGQLGSVLSQIPARRSAGDGGYPRHLQPGAHG
jgi:Aldo/keto reductase family